MTLTNNIGYLLHHLSSVLDRQSDQILQEQLGIGFSQFKIMMVLKWSPHLRQRQIADNLGQTEASISRQIKLMKNMRLLSMERNPKNKREHITNLTDRGARLTESALEVLNKYHAPIFARLTDKQRADILHTLDIMHESACGSHEPGTTQV